MKKFKMSVTVTELKRTAVFSNTYTAKVSLSDETNFSELVKFMSDAKMVWKKAMAAVKAGSYMEMEVVEAVYEHHPGENVEQTSFDRWVSIPTHKQDGEGIYLLPDTRYTKENRDMYLTKDLLNDMSFTLR